MEGGRGTAVLSPLEDALPVAVDCGGGVLGGRGSFGSMSLTEAGFPTDFNRRLKDCRLRAESLTCDVSSSTSSSQDDPALDPELERDRDCRLAGIIMQQMDTTITHCITNMAMNQSSSIDEEENDDTVL